MNLAFLMGVGLLAVFLMVVGSMGVNLHNRCAAFRHEKAAHYIFITMIIFLILGVLGVVLAGVLIYQRARSPAALAGAMGGATGMLGRVGRGGPPPGQRRRWTRTEEGGTAAMLILGTLLTAAGALGVHMHNDCADFKAGKEGTKKKGTVEHAEFVFFAVLTGLGVAGVVGGGTYIYMHNRALRGAGEGRGRSARPPPPADMSSLPPPSPSPAQSARSGSSGGGAIGGGGGPRGQAFFGTNTNRNPSPRGGGGSGSGSGGLAMPSSADMSRVQSTLQAQQERLEGLRQRMAMPASA